MSVKLFRKKKNNVWYLDSSCNDMIKNENIFCKLDKDKTKIKIDNDDFREAQENAQLLLTHEKVEDTSMIYFYIDQNLLDMEQMMEKWYSLHFEGDCCILYDKRDKHLEIARIKMKVNRRFAIQRTYANNIAMQKHANKSWLQHRKFEHFNFQRLKNLYEKNMMRDFPTIKKINNVCERCMLRKQHR